VAFQNIDEKPGPDRLHLLAKYEKKDVKKLALILHFKVVLDPNNKRSKSVSAKLKEDTIWYLKKVGHCVDSDEVMVTFFLCVGDEYEYDAQGISGTSFV